MTPNRLTTALLAGAPSRGNLYSIQAKVPDSTDAARARRVVAAASSAIGAGPR